MNLTDMRTLVRRDLRDENSSNYRWTNDQLDRHIGHAVRDLSADVPLQQKAAIATAAGSRDINIASLTDRVMVMAVEYPADAYPKSYQRWSLWEDTLTLLCEEAPDGSNACVYYGKLHTLTGTASTIPAVHEDLVAAGTAGYAAVEWAIYSVNQVNTGGSRTSGEFLGWGQEILAWFRKELNRLRTNNRVRSRSLYRSYYPAVSRAGDFGPG